MTEEKKPTKKVEKKEERGQEEGMGGLIAYEKQSTSVDSIISQAIEKGVEPEIMERFLAMRKELKKEWAKEQFDLAMANAQSRFPEIKKTKEVKDNNGKLLYKYASIDEIVRQVKGILSENGLSYFIKTEVGENKVKSICIVKHIAGHSESSDMEVPLGTKTGIMSDSQVTAAAATFSKGYAFMNAFGIMTGDEDKEHSHKEENLRDATEDEVKKAITKLDKCSDVDTLKEVWSGLSKEVRANKDVIRYTNEIKGNIQNENSQGGKTA